jgi:hypothetical protein
MLDLNYVLNFRPGNAEALTLRGIAWSAMHDYGKALADLNQALGKMETIEGILRERKSTNRKMTFRTRRPILH